MDVDVLRSRVTLSYVSRLILPTLEPLGSRFCVLGPSGCGKDTAAAFLAMNFAMKYDGPSSLFLCSLLWPEDVPTFYRNRHAFADILYDFGCLIRSIEPRMIPMSVAAQSNIIVGLRGWPDIDAAMHHGIVEHIIWINSVGLSKPDPTLEIDYDSLWRYYPDQTYVVNNIAGRKGKFFNDLADIVDMLGVERWLNMSPNFEKYGVRYLDVR